MSKKVYLIAAALLVVVAVAVFSAPSELFQGNIYESIADVDEREAEIEAEMADLDAQALALEEGFNAEAEYIKGEIYALEASLSQAEKACAKEEGYLIAKYKKNKLSEAELSDLRNEINKVKTNCRSAANSIGADIDAYKDKFNAADTEYSMKMDEIEARQDELKSELDSLEENRANLEEQDEDNQGVAPLLEVRLAETDPRWQQVKIGQKGVELFSFRIINHHDDTLHIENMEFYLNGDAENLVDSGVRFQRRSSKYTFSSSRVYAPNDEGIINFSPGTIRANDEKYYYVLADISDTAVAADSLTLMLNSVEPCFNSRCNEPLSNDQYIAETVHNISLTIAAGTASEIEFNGVRDHVNQLYNYVNWGQEQATVGEYQLTRVAGSGESHINRLMFELSGSDPYDEENNEFEVFDVFGDGYLMNANNEVIATSEPIYQLPPNNLDLGLYIFDIPDGLLTVEDATTIRLAADVRNNAAQYNGRYLPMRFALNKTGMKIFNTENNSFDMVTPVAPFTGEPITTVTTAGTGLVTQIIN